MAFQKLNFVPYYADEPDGPQYCPEASSYTGLLATCGVEILAEAHVGDWQGQIHALVKEGDKFGYFTTWYGSCGGCDTLEGMRDDCEPPEKYEEYRQSLYDDVLWFHDKAEALAHLTGLSNDDVWSRSGDKDWKRFQDEVKKALS